MRTKSKFNFYVLLCFAFLSIYHIRAQTDTDKMKQTVLEADANFWTAYNNCNFEGFQSYLTEDLEFYHDKGGLTSGLNTFLKQVGNGLCSNKNGRLRREAVEGSVQIFPLKNYGTVMTGEHVFYLTEDNSAKERLIEKAKFTHVWQLLKTGKYKMARVISYDHQAISLNDFKMEVVVSRKTLEGYVGNYLAPKTGMVNISISKENFLNLDAGPLKAKLHPESNSVFFIKEAPISLEFITDNKGYTNQFIVRENGQVVEKAIRQ
ncbi:nuclear transport factor 2 family protein [Maribacter sp. 2210JD10-5]|uniref:nuclear transport factor 2 family protein n=1 Tax=Maribacter sp. 2210JD10-5 TaxID=3386272 RepID=UPI0039BD864A